MNILSSTFFDIQFDLIGVVVAVIGILVLAGIVFARRTNSNTSRSFFFFAFVTICWGLSNCISKKVEESIFI